MATLHLNNANRPEGWLHSPPFTLHLFFFALVSGVAAESDICVELCAGTIY
jgi:hypothetical protein